MLVEELMMIYEQEKHEKPASVDCLLDYYQRKYIDEHITINEYARIYAYLSNQGAVSCHDHE